MNVDGDKQQEIEIENLEDTLTKLKNQRGVTLTHLERLMMYQKYLEAVVETATQYHEINDLLLRSPFILASPIQIEKRNPSGCHICIHHTFCFLDVDTGAFSHRLSFPYPDTERIFIYFTWSCKKTW